MNLEPVTPPHPCTCKDRQTGRHTRAHTHTRDTVILSHDIAHMHTHAHTCVLTLTHTIIQILGKQEPFSLRPPWAIGQSVAEGDKAGFGLN